MHVKRSLFGVREMTEDYWNGGGDPTPRSWWPFALITAGLLVLAVVAIFAL